MNVFTRGLIVRILIICGIAGLCGWCLTLEQLWATKLLLTFLFAGAIAEIVNYAGNPQLKISSFVESVLYSNDLPVFNLPAKDDAELVFRRFIEVIRQIKIEKQSEYELFTAAVNHLAVPLMVFDHNGDVKLCNKSALKLLGLPVITTIRQIISVSHELYNTLSSLKTDEQLLVKTNLSGRLVKLSIRATRIQFSQKIFMIVTLQDIQQEIAKEETEAWQKIIRILAHEIINSTSPINILSESLMKIISKNEWSDSDRYNIKSGLQAINKRSRGMTAFVENYRTMTFVPAPSCMQTNINELLQQVSLLFKEETDTKNIKLNIIAIDNPVIQTDERLLEQVLINLVRNAIDAADKQQSVIDINTVFNENTLLIKIKDNGCGIKSENIENIFTPFFTTKKGGNGIGLFISRKIIQTLNGTLTLQSQEGQGSVFFIQIPSGNRPT